MKRDMDIIRKMAFAIEALQPGEKLTTLGTLDADTFNVHALWMHQANLVQARLYTDQRDVLTGANLIRLTWEGCEFLDSVRSDTLWLKAKACVLIPTASITFGVLKDWLSKQISDGLPAIGS